MLLLMIVLLISFPVLIFLFAIRENGWGKVRYVLSMRARAPSSRMAFSPAYGTRPKDGTETTFGTIQPDVLVAYFERAFEKIEKLDEKYTRLFEIDIEQATTIAEDINKFRDSTFDIINNQRRAIEASNLSDREKMLVVIEGQTELLRVWGFLISALVSTGKGYPRN